MRLSTQEAKLASQLSREAQIEELAKTACQWTISPDCVIDASLVPATFSARPCRLGIYSIAKTCGVILSDSRSSVDSKFCRLKAKQSLIAGASGIPRGIPSCAHIESNLFLRGDRLSRNVEQQQL